MVEKKQSLYIWIHVIIILELHSLSCDYIYLYIVVILKSNRLTWVHQITSHRFRFIKQLQTNRSGITLDILSTLGNTPVMKDRLIKMDRDFGILFCRLGVSLEFLLEHCLVRMI